MRLFCTDENQVREVFKSSVWLWVKGELIEFESALCGTCGKELSRVRVPVEESDSLGLGIERGIPPKGSIKDYSSEGA